MRLNKKIILGVVLGAFCLSLLPVAIPTVRAQFDEPGFAPANTPQQVINNSNTINTQAAQRAQQQTGGDDIGCLVGAGGVSNTVALCLTNIVYVFTVGIFSSIAYICAFFFDLAVQLSLNSTTYALGFLTTSWTIIRDLSNMAFIFILIYIAMEVMLLADDSQTMRTLIAVIVVALLINFSFFFTRVAIDAGNLLALQFYNAIQAPNIGATSASSLSSALSGGATNNQAPASSIASNLTSLASASQTKDLTASIMNGIQVQNIISSNSFKQYTQANQGVVSSMYIFIALATIYISVGIAFGILAGSFLYAGAKFMLRIVGLWFIIIFSPLALVAAAMPNATANKLFKDYWLKNLVNFSFYPAVFLFMFLVLSRFMTELNKDGNFLNGVFGQSLTASNDFSLAFLNILSAIANVGIRLGFVVAMMYLALSAADIIAKYRGDITSPWARKASGWMGNMITGGAFGVVGRTAVRAGNFVSGGRLGMQDLTFDPRNSRLGRLTGIPTLLGRYDPATKTPHETYGAVPISWGQTASAKDMAKAATEAGKERERERRDAENKKRDKETAEAIKRVATDAKAGRASVPKDTERVKNLSKRELESLKEAEVKSIIHAVNENQLKTLTDSERFSDKTKDEFRKDWNEKNGSSPLLKSQRILATELRTLSASIATAHVKAALTDVDTNSASGHNLKGSSVIEMRENINDQIAQLRSDIRTAAPGATTKDLQKDLAKLQNALDSVKRLGDERGKVPAGAGGLPNAGEFVVA